MNEKKDMALTSHSHSFRLIKTPHSYRLHTQYGIMFKIQNSQKCCIMQDVPALHDSLIYSVANYSRAFGNFSLPLVAQ